MKANPVFKIAKTVKRVFTLLSPLQSFERAVP